MKTPLLSMQRARLEATTGVEQSKKHIAKMRTIAQHAGWGEDVADALTKAYRAVKAAGETVRDVPSNPGNMHSETDQ